MENCIHKKILKTKAIERCTEFLKKVFPSISDDALNEFKSFLDCRICEDEDGRIIVGIDMDKESLEFLAEN